MQALALSLYVEVVRRAGVGELGSMDLEGLVRENRALEWVQVGLLGLIAALCSGSFRPGQPPLHRLLALFAIFATFRELDSLLEDVLFERAHWIGMGAALGGIGFILATGGAGLRSDISGFLHRPGFFLMVFGVSFVVIYGQILGQREIWKILTPDLVSESKRFIEEGLETAGYLIIGCGVVEERFFTNHHADLKSKS